MSKSKRRRIVKRAKDIYVEHHRAMWKLADVYLENLLQMYREELPVGTRFKTTHDGFVIPMGITFVTVSEVYDDRMVGRTSFMVQARRVDSLGRPNGKVTNFYVKDVLPGI
jgi:hypothetical protein